MLFEILRAIRQGLRLSLLGNKESVKKSGGKMLGLHLYQFGVAGSVAL